MLEISEGAIRAAFRAYQDVYGRKGWGVQEYAPLWEHSRQAFECDDRPSFTKLYAGLRRGWLVFRTSAANAPPKSDDEVYAILRSLDERLRTRRLSLLDESDTPALRAALNVSAAIKLNKSGASLVAVSKFLHFWNPRLFVIVDGQVMDSFVFQQAWLCGEIAAVNREIVPALHDASYPLKGPYTQFHYEAILRWAGRLLSANPNIPALFAEFAKGEKVQEPGGGFAQFEAAAVEMLLLGLANMPPAGVHIVDTADEAGP